MIKITKNEAMKMSPKTFKNLEKHYQEEVGFEIGIEYEYYFEPKDEFVGRLHIWGPSFRNNQYIEISECSQVTQWMKDNKIKS